MKKIIEYLGHTITYAHECYFALGKAFKTLGAAKKQIEYEEAHY